MRVFIVGGVAGGASTAARLRRLNESASITILERGDYISYANCGLPYYIGGSIKQKSALTVQTPQGFQRRFNVEVRTNHEVTAVDGQDKAIYITDLKSGRQYRESYDVLVLSPGAKPVVPPLEGIDDRRIFTLRSIPDTYAISEYVDQAKPKTATVIGGGAIGVEMAENFAQLGIEVTIVDKATHIITSLDGDMATLVQRHLCRRGIKLQLDCGVERFHDQGDHVSVVTERGPIKSDLVLLSVGVTPDTSFLQGSGVERSPRGHILVDSHMRTNLPDVYAVGDAVEIPHLVTGRASAIGLAGPANKQGRIAADNIAGLDRVYRGSQGTAIIKAFDMVAASTGINEKQATEDGFDWDKIYIWSPSHATYYPKATMMCIKVIFERNSGKLLGAAIVGFDGVDKRIDVLAAAIRGNLTAYDLTELELAYAPPFSSAKDPVNMAGYTMENLLDGRVEQVHHDEMIELKERRDVILIDVRTAGEFKRGHIEGSLHIPVDNLRQRLHEINKEKPVYLICETGMRSYVACRVLRQKGYKCYHLAGGYRLYSTLHQNADLENAAMTSCGSHSA